MLREPARAREMGRAGRRLMLERFTLSRTVGDLHELYRRLRGRQARRYYDPARTLLRALIALPVLTYLSFRLVFVDTLMLTYVPRLLKSARTPTSDDSAG
jgi:hypothetical protein